MSVKIPAEITNALGLKTDDPGAVVFAFFKQLTSPLRTLHNRVVQRLDVKTIVIEDNDPKKAGKQRATVTIKASSGDDPGRLAAKVATLVSRGRGDLYIDEARRMVLGMKVGPKPSKGLDGEEHNEMVDPSSLALLAPQMQARGLFGIDDIIIISIAIPIICALIPIVLPTIIEWGKDVFKIEDPNKQGAGPDGKTGTADDVPLGPDGNPAPVAAAKSSSSSLLLIGAAVAVAAVLFMKRKG
jgi:hypothetical protein